MISIYGIVEYLLLGTHVNVYQNIKRVGHINNAVALFVAGNL